MNSLKFKRDLSFLILPLFLSFPAQYLSLFIINLIKKTKLSAFYTEFFFPQLFYPLFFLCFYLIAVKLLLKKELTFTPLKGEAKPLMAINSTVVFVGTAIVLATLYEKLLSLINSSTVIIKPLSYYSIEPKGVTESFLYLIVLTFIPAIVEETVFRGVILSGLSKYIGKFSIIISALLFALMHANFNQIPVAFVMGLFLSYSAYRYKSLLLPMVMHFFNNFCSSIFKILRVNLSPKAYELSDKITTLIFIILSILIIIIELFRKNRRKLFEDEEKPPKNFIRDIFLSFGFMAYAVFNLYIAVAINF